MTMNSSFWAGTEASLHQYLLKEMQVQKEGFGVLYTSEPHEEPKGSRLLTVVGNVGVIAISGSLNNSADAYMNKWMERTGYPEIREALVQAASDTSIGAIVLDVNSGGGLVAGVTDTADLISSIDKGVKPVYAHSDGAAMSAAYWLACSARSVSCGPVAELGSIGVLAIHQEVSKMMESIGIKPTVLRSGKYKALGNPYEPLSALAMEELQGQLDQVYAMFAGHVAEHRGVSYAVADSHMGQGRVFIGERAKSVSLADEISNFDAVVGKAQSTVDKKNSAGQYGLKSTGTILKTALTPQAIAALAEGGGVVVDADGLAANAEAARLVDIAALAEAAKLADAAALKLAPAAPSPDLVNFLQSQLSAAQAQVATLTVSALAADARIKTIETSQAGLRAIAQASVERMSFALNLPNVVATGDETLLAQHASLRVEFEKNFKAGGVAAVSTGGPESEKKAVPDAARSARIAATRSK